MSATFAIRCEACMTDHDARTGLCACVPTSFVRIIGIAFPIVEIIKFHNGIARVILDEIGETLVKTSDIQITINY